MSKLKALAISMNETRWAIYRAYNGIEWLLIWFLFGTMLIPLVLVSNLVTPYHWRVVNLIGTAAVLMQMFCWCGSLIFTYPALVAWLHSASWTKRGYFLIFVLVMLNAVLLMKDYG